MTTGVDGLNIQYLDIRTQYGAQHSLGELSSAMIKTDTVRANLGATQNRLENTISNLQIQSENLQAAESQISDTDVAQEMTSFVREQILTQAATAMLTQANSMPKMALQLITG
nr:flagellin [Solidesulfovibrio alcoholivorans]